MQTFFLGRIWVIAIFALAACSGGSPQAPMPPQSAGATGTSPTMPPQNAGATGTSPTFTVGGVPAKITEFPIAAGDIGPAAITVGTDGSAWFLSQNAANRITLAGTVTQFDDQGFVNYNNNTDIALGPDGALYFTANCVGPAVIIPPFNCSSGFQVELLRTRSGSFSFVATAENGFFNQMEGPFPTGIAFGANTVSAVVPVSLTPQNNGSGYVVVRPDGTQILSKTLPASCFNLPGAGPGMLWDIASGIARGSDGAFYVTVRTQCEGLPNAPPDGVLRIDASGNVTNRFAVPNAQRITAGPDGNLWVTQNGATNAIARVTPSGAVTEFPIPTPNANPIGIVAGNDGAIWFAEHDANKVGRITTAGEMSEFATPTANSAPFGVASLPGACGPGHGQIWFTEFNANKIGRIDF